MLNFLINIAHAFDQPTGSIVTCGPADASGHYPNGNYTGPCDAGAFWGLVNTLINYAIWIGIVAVGLSVVFAGVMFLTSAGSGEKTSAGKRAVTAAVVGLVITLTAWIIVNTIISFLLPNCTGHWNIFNNGTSSLTCS